MAIDLQGHVGAWRSRSSRGCCWRPASACSAARCSGCPAALLAWPLRALRRLRAARAHEPGRQPLADRRAGDADRARRDARRHAGHRPDQRRSATPSDVTAARVTAPFVRHRPRRRAAPAEDRRAIARSHGVDCRRARREIYPRDVRLRRGRAVAGRRPRGHGHAGARPARHRAATCAPCTATPSRSAACSPRPGDLRVGDTFAARLADTTRHTLRVAAIYARAAGLGDVVLADAPAPIDAIFVQRRLDRAHVAASRC